MRPVRAAPLALALALLCINAALAQHTGRPTHLPPPPPYCPPSPPWLPNPTPPAQQWPATPTQPTTPSQPTTPTQPGTTPTTPANPTPTTPQTDSSQNANAGNAANNTNTGSEQASLGNESFAAGGGESGAAAIGAGYVDPAWIRSQFRLRYDSGYNDNRPDRAEFFYAGPAGPPLPERSIDFQDVSVYLEGAFNERFSVFAELPVRWLNPDINANTNGLGDMNAGFKAGILTEPKQLLTFQLRAYAPTGDPGRGLGTAHASLEPGFLYHQQFDRLFFDGEVKYWVPLTGNGFAGDLFRYGAGVSYNLACRKDRFLAPVAEIVGWTVLSGRETVGAPFGTEISKSAAGDTIVNAKLGVRYGWNLYDSVYVGYGRALTGEVWYKDLIRLEYRRAF